MSKFLLNLLVQISKALVNSEIQFLIRKFFFLAFGSADLAAHSTVGPAGPTGLSPLTGQIQPCRPSQPACRRRNCGSTFSLLARAFRAGRLLLVSLSSGPGLSDSSSSPTGQPFPLPRVTSGHPAPPGLQPRDVRRGLHSTPSFPPPLNFTP
jgi:hypothetical protein